jgi:hypothetical protein
MFEEDAAAVGAADRGQGRGVAAFDYDRDGDLDLLIADSEQAPRLLRNDGGADHHWLSVALRGDGANSEAIGARVSVRAGGLTQLREIRAGSNYASQDPAEAHFGLGDAVVVDVTVRWPDGATTELPGVAANQSLRIAR